MITSFMLATAVVLMPSARIADMLGKKKILPFEGRRNRGGKDRQSHRRKDSYAENEKDTISG